MLPLLVSLAAHATGMPPMDTLQVVGADCSPQSGPVEQVFVTFDRITGTCAPNPAGDPCSTWVEESLDASRLVVRRRGCEEPQRGRFVEAGQCGDVPRWRWTGRLDAGHRHFIGRDFQQPLGLVEAAGAPTDAACPALSPKTHPVATPVVVSPPGAPQWIAMPAETYSVAGEGAAARLTWTPGPTLLGWVLRDEDAVLQSAPLPRAEAEALLAEARREPMGLAVRHRVTEHREHFEGWTQRGVAQCERILEMDLEQRLRLGSEGERLGPPMTATVALREPAAAEQCAAGAPQ